MTQTVLDAALSLPSEERAMLAERLWASLPDGNLDEEFAKELAVEIQERRARHAHGQSQLHEWSNVRRDLTAIIDRAENR